MAQPPEVDVPPPAKSPLIVELVVCVTNSNDGTLQRTGCVNVQLTVVWGAGSGSALLWMPAAVVLASPVERLRCQGNWAFGLSAEEEQRPAYRSEYGHLFAHLGQP